MAKRPREHELETESERELRNLLPAAWVLRDMTKGDYGVDGEVEVFEDGATTGLTFKVQLKGTDSTKPTRSVPISQFMYWRSLDVPVLLVLWQAKVPTLRAMWAHSHDPGRIAGDQASTTVRFFPEHDLSSWWDQIPEQLRLIRSITRGTVAFPLPIRVEAPSAADVARLHAALRQQLTARGLQGVFTVDADSGPALIATFESSRLRVALPLELRSLTVHGPRGSMSREPGLATSIAIDILATAALLISPIGTGELAGKVLSSTMIDSNLFRMDNSADLLEQVVATLRETADFDALVNLLEYVSTESHLAETSGEAFLLLAATSAPLEPEQATRIAAVLRGRSDEARSQDPETSARYLFNAGASSGGQRNRSSWMSSEGRA